MCNWRGWGKLLDLACEYGWKPTGTRHVELWMPVALPEQDTVGTKEFTAILHDLDVGYFSNDGQVVHGDDCRSMLRALEAARTDIGKGCHKEGSNADRVARNESSRRLLDEMITVCKVGFFHIW